MVVYVFPKFRQNLRRSAIFRVDLAWNYPFVSPSVSPLEREVTGSRLDPEALVGFSIAFLSAETVRYNSDGMGESAWTIYHCL